MIVFIVFILAVTLTLMYRFPMVFQACEGVVNFGFFFIDNVPYFLNGLSFSLFLNFGVLSLCMYITDIPSDYARATRNDFVKLSFIYHYYSRRDRRVSHVP